ncbi:MAG: threonine synthase [Actinobacteria bacterium]|nr:threonine synthase [Actinomycetota bacterium]
MSPAPTSTTVSDLRCSRCDARYAPLERHHVCTNTTGGGACGAPLLVVYDLAAVAQGLDPTRLSARPATMWRYRELLPVPLDADVVSLGEGFTPLLRSDALARKLGVGTVWLKDDGLNPTGTFKARGAACGVSMAVVLGVTEVALPTAGNAGGAWAAYGAAARMRVRVAVPSDAPLINRLEPLTHGAEVSEVDGDIAVASALIAEGIAEHGWYDAATLREPYRIEGKKTLGFEIAEQLALEADAPRPPWPLPDAVVYPAGGGVGIIGIWRALEQLQELGWVLGPLPRMIVVQAAGCAPIVSAFESGADVSRFWEDADTIASGLRVPKALGDFLVLRAVRESGGVCVAVEDGATLASLREVATTTGVLCAPEGAAAVAGVRELVARGELGRGDRVVVINTGSGLKYPEVLAALRR